MIEGFNLQEQDEGTPLDDMRRAQGNRDQRENFFKSIEGVAELKVVVRFVERYIQDSRPEVRELAENIMDDLERTMTKYNNKTLSANEILGTVLMLALFASKSEREEGLLNDRKEDALRAFQDVIQWADKKIPSVLSEEEAQALKQEPVE